MNRKVNRIKKGFSLVELMSALLILAILTGVAIPTYREYQIRSRMIDVVKTLENLLDIAKQQYVSANTIPTSIEGISSGTLTAYTGSTCINYVFYNDGSAWNNAGKAAMVQGKISSECGQGIQGFVAATSSGSPGSSNTVTVGFLASGEYLDQFCGTWVDDGTQVPSSYLPIGCQNDAFETSVTG